MDRTAHHTPAPPRRLRMVDLMVLVAIAGLGAWLFRSGRPAVEMMYVRTGPSYGPSGWVGALVWRWWGPANLYIEWFLLLGGAALLVLMAIPPRPRWRLLRRRPGFLIASTTTAIACAHAAAMIVASWGLGGMSFSPTWGNIISGTPGTAGWSATGIVAALAIAGRVNMAVTWLDRLAVALGYGWVLINTSVLAHTIATFYCL